MINNGGIDRAAHNALLLLLARGAQVLLIPIVLAGGFWVVSTVQDLRVDVTGLTERVGAQITAMSAASTRQEIRLDRIEDRISNANTKQ